MPPDPKRNFTDEDIQRIADAVRSKIGSSAPAWKPLHEMTEWERTAYANETWAASGIIPSPPANRPTISGGGK